MLTIRLRRAGGKHRPFYHVISTENLTRRDKGSCVQLGHFDPFTHQISLKIDQIKILVQNGAKLSEAVKHLIKKYEKQPAHHAR